MTPAQLAALRTAIAADATLAGLPKNDDTNLAIADAFNLDATPAYTVWRTSLATASIAAVLTWTEVDNLTVGKARIWEWMSRLGTINPSIANVRAGLSQCFGTASATAASVTPLMKRPASRVERLYAVATPNQAGTAGSDASPGTLVYEGPLSPAEVAAARAD
jgi:hypothetical protein